MAGGILLILRLLLAITLYVFLGWVMLILWRNLKYQQEAITGQQVPEIVLQIEDHEPVQSYHFRKPVLIIGRDPDCECTLASEKVSVRHARLSFHQNQWWIEDLKFNQWKFLNEEPILVAAVVVDSDHLRCGDVEMTIKIDRGLDDLLVD